MKAFSRILQVAALLLSLAGNANANFHLWRTDQIYSNADGNVQFIVLMALSSGQEFINGHTITVTQGSTVHTYTFTKSLSGDTATTTGDARLRRHDSGQVDAARDAGLREPRHQVTPDFIIPDNFLFTSGGGSIDWGGGYDTFNYTSIPMDGNMALFRAGSDRDQRAQQLPGADGLHRRAPRRPSTCRGCGGILPPTPNRDGASTSRSRARSSSARGSPTTPMAAACGS